MTRAPANLLAVRSLLLTHLDNAPGPDDLDPGEVGIVGDPAHRGGYHCGSDRVVTNDYSVVESPRDRAGLNDYAAGLDVGQFRVTTPKGTFDLPHYSRWLVAQCAANTVDTRDIREVIYSPDGTTVKRWDRLGKRSSGDSSHRWHTHKSYFRDAIKAGRDQTAVVRRYLTEIGLIKAPTSTEDDMPTAQEIAKALGDYLVTADIWPNGYGDRATNPKIALGTFVAAVANDTYTMRGSTARTEQAVAQLAGKDFTDEPAIVAGVLASLTPEKIAAAIPPTMAKQVADELTRRLVE
ncbi:hypothetical protein ACFYL6_20925 [Micromonospora sp. NPDC007208]|uniref:hypothetical protein n=1 Tax=Micromonospora sp. NPDC007208 TaxID=3364236 RepID=UPI00368FD5D1